MNIACGKLVPTLSTNMSSGATRIGACRVVPDANSMGPVALYCSMFAPIASPPSTAPIVITPAAKSCGEDVEPDVFTDQVSAPSPKPISFKNSPFSVVSGVPIKM